MEWFETEILKKTLENYALIILKGSFTSLKFQRVYEFICQQYFTIIPNEVKGTQD